MLHPRTWKLLADSDLTDAEALQAVAEVQGGLVKTLLRAERHPGHDGCKADEACEEPGCPGNRKEPGHVD